MANIIKPQDFLNQRQIQHAIIIEDVQRFIRIKLKRFHANQKVDFIDWWRREKSPMWNKWCQATFLLPNHCFFRTFLASEWKTIHPADTLLEIRPFMDLVCLSDKFLYRLQFNWFTFLGEYHSYSCNRLII